MPHGTAEVSGVSLTNEEIKILLNILKHPKIKDLAKEIEDEKNKK